MKIKIYNLLQKYSFRPCDTNYMKDIISYSISNDQLENYIKEFKIDNVNDATGIGQYDWNKKILTIYSKKLNKLYHQMNSLENILSQQELLYYKNLVITEIILHEINHAKQKKSIDSTVDYESILFTLERRLIKNQNDYIANYSDSIIERQAEVNALAAINSIAKYTHEQFPTLSNLTEYDYLKRVLSGYEISSPIEKFCTRYNISYFDCDKIIKEYNVSDNNLSFYKRLELGLPIKKEEHLKLNDQYNKVKQLIIK